MKVLFDYQTFHIQRFGGISKYFTELIHGFSETESKIAIQWSMNQYLPQIKNVSYINVSKRLFKLLEGLFRIINKQHSISVIKKGNFDVFHPTYYDPYFLDYLNGKPFVLTIHDMTHERFPQYFAQTDPTIQNKRILAEKATRIIAISESTKRDIIEYLHIPEHKIDVIYHGHTPQKLAAGKPVGIPEQYILYVGERRGYKNFELVFEAFAQISTQYDKLHLVLTGRPLSHKEHEMVRTAVLEKRIIIMNDINDTCLAQLYRNAILFIYPSLYEGFGIPILEAFAQDCPVILSNASCFPEVASDAAEYFEATSLDSLVSAMMTVMTNDIRKQELIKKGRERLKQFTWSETARQTEQTYHKVCKK